MREITDLFSPATQRYLTDELTACRVLLDDPNEFESMVNSFIEKTLTRISAETFGVGSVDAFKIAFGDLRNRMRAANARYIESIRSPRAAEQIKKMLSDFARYQWSAGEKAGLINCLPEGWTIMGVDFEHVICDRGELSRNHIRSFMNPGTEGTPDHIIAEAKLAASQARRTKPSHTGITGPNGFMPFHKGGEIV